MLNLAQDASRRPPGRDRPRHGHAAGARFRAGRARPGAPLLSAVFAILVASLLAGCATTPGGRDPERMAGPEDPLQIPGAETIGVIIYVDPAEDVALVRVRSSSTRSAPLLIARNESLIETARLEPTRFQRGRTLGTRILSGLPNVGDEVIIAR